MTHTEHIFRSSRITSGFASGMIAARWIQIWCPKYQSPSPRSGDLFGNCFGFCCLNASGEISGIGRSFFGGGGQVVGNMRGLELLCFGQLFWTKWHILSFVSCCQPICLSCAVSGGIWCWLSSMWWGCLIQLCYNRLELLLYRWT